MLRASAAAIDTPLDLRGIVDDAIDPLVPGGRQLRALADVVVDRDSAARVDALAAVDAAIDDGASTTAAGVAANFQMMNRLLDATGVPVPDGRVDLGRALGVRPA